MSKSHRNHISEWLALSETAFAGFKGQPKLSKSKEGIRRTGSVSRQFCFGVYGTSHSCPTRVYAAALLMSALGIFRRLNNQGAPPTSVLCRATARIRFGGVPRGCRCLEPLRVRTTYPEHLKQAFTVFGADCSSTPGNPAGARNRRLPHRSHRPSARVRRSVAWPSPRVEVCA